MPQPTGLHHTFAGLRITDATQFTAWHSAEQLAQERLIPDAPADAEGDAAAFASPQPISTPQPPGGEGAAYNNAPSSSIRRPRSPGPRAGAGAEGGASAAAGARSLRRRLNFDARPQVLRLP